MGSERLQEIRDRMERAGGRDVTLVGVAKFQPVELVQRLVDAGLRDLGVNYLQAGEELRARLTGFAGNWHFIGQIQSRKATGLGSYDRIHSLDRLKVAQRLAPGLSVLVEVNLGDESSKGGVREPELESFLESLSGLPLELKGLMTLPPPLYPVEKRRPYFARLRELMERYRGYFSGRELSMGTSDDFEEAIREGATCVRLGTVLFGPRQR